MRFTKTTMIMDGRKVRYYRKQKGLSQARLARKVGISQSMVSKIERRAFQPKAHIAERLAKVLCVPLEQLGDAGPLPTTGSRTNPVEWNELRHSEGQHPQV